MSDFLKLKTVMITNQQIIDQINHYLKNTPVFYVTREKERGMGIEDLIKNYQIITSSLPKDTAEIIKENSWPLKANIIVFKNNARIQRICQEKKIRLLNPDYQLTENFENKISQYQWLKKIIPNHIPKTIITTPEKSSFKKIQKTLGKKFIGQFNHSHSGEGTFLFSQKNQWEKIKEKFPLREIKCTSFLKNISFTLNACVWKNCTLVSFPSAQITGLKKLTDFPFSTNGNDWSLSNQTISEKDWKIIRKITQIIGTSMKNQGWIGLFGVDLIKNKNKWMVVEINSRQPASSGLEAILQRKQGKGLTTLTAHLASFLKLPLPTDCLSLQNSWQKVSQGSQIIFRKKEKNNLKINNDFNLPNFNLIKTNLNAKKINQEVWRCQSFKKGMINKKNRLNKTGKKIIKLINE